MENNFYTQRHRKNSLLRFLTKVLVTTLGVYITAWMFNGVVIDKFTTAIFVAIVLSFFNIFLKPILVVLTIPLTIFTFGLFLLVINAVMVLLASEIVEGFYVSSFWTAVWFSLVLSILVGLMEGFDNSRRLVFHTKRGSSQKKDTHFDDYTEIKDDDTENENR